MSARDNKMADDKQYDYIVYGDELPGVISAIQFAREYTERTGQYPKVLLMRSSEDNLGGHTTNGLGYLDRSIGTIGLEPSQSEIYNEILAKSGSNGLGLDGDSADTVIRDMMREAGVDLLSGANIKSVVKGIDGTITAIKASPKASPKASLGFYESTFFSDAMQTGQLAEAAGAQMSKGFESVGLRESALSTGVPFEVSNMSLQELQDLELRMHNKLSRWWDPQAYNWIKTASGHDPNTERELRKEIENFQPLYVHRDENGKVIGADVKSGVLGIVYHGQSGTQMDLKENNPLFDKANIAVLNNGSLSFNNMLVRTSPEQSNAIDKNSGRPTDDLKPLIDDTEDNIKTFFSRNLNANAQLGKQLDVRYAQAVENVRQPLSGSDMVMGGVPEDEASSSFSYHLDSRGGIEGAQSLLTASYMPGSDKNGKPISAMQERLELPKVSFNAGVEHTLSTDVNNLTVLGPATGYEGLGVTAGRITEMSAATAENLARAQVDALLNGDTTTQNITNEQARSLKLASGHNIKGASSSVTSQLDATKIDNVRRLEETGGIIKAQQDKGILSQAAGFEPQPTGLMSQVKQVVGSALVQMRSPGQNPQASPAAALTPPVQPAVTTGLAPADQMAHSWRQASIAPVPASPLSPTIGNVARLG
jgi:hypothetical protein